MTKEEFTRAFVALSQEEKHEVAAEIMRNYCRFPGGCVGEMMSLCSGMMGGMFGLPFGTAAHTGERA